MITLFYKILYKKECVVYVGVTTRSLVQRFTEHVKKKELNESERLLWYCSLKSCLYLFDLLKGVNL